MRLDARPSFTATESASRWAQGRSIGIVGIDLDKCVDPGGRIDPRAMEIVRDLDSYTERTPSGNGLRVLIQARKPGRRCRTKDHPGIEVYESGRYFTVSGRYLQGTPTALASRQDALEALYAKLFPDKAKPQTGGNGHPSNGHGFASDDDLVNKARKAKNGPKFTALFDRGDIGGYPSQSEADQALANLLAFWTRCDFDRMESIFGRSALGQRDKWRNRPEYREWTIDRAIDDCSDVYTPSVAAGTLEQRRFAIQVNEAADDPHRLARLHLGKFQHDGQPTLRFYRGEFHRWTDGAYRAVSDSEQQSGFAGTIKDEFDRLNCAAIDLWNDRGEKDAAGKPVEKPEARKISRTLVSNSTLALQSMTLISGRVEAPSWISDKRRSTPRRSCRPGMP